MTTDHDGVATANTNNALLIGGVDPGLASGGLVVLRLPQEQVVAAMSLVEPRDAKRRAQKEALAIADRYFGGWSDVEYLAADARAAMWVQRFGRALDDLEAEHGRVSCFAVESFVDQPSRARRERRALVRHRWQTPLLMGRLARELEDRGYAPHNGGVVYQNAGIVLKQMSSELAQLRARRRDDVDVIVDGDRLVTNNHTRTALMHALALSLRMKTRGVGFGEADATTETSPTRIKEAV
jgi:hypothetical protein